MQSLFPLKIFRAAEHNETFETAELMLVVHSKHRDVEEKIFILSLESHVS